MTWQLDSSHSQIQFAVRHLMISKVRGNFNEFTFDVNYDEETRANSSVVVTIDTSSASTNDAQRDGHLQSPDFFNVAEFPTATFQSTRVEMTDDNEGRIYGDLTIRDTMKEVVIEAEYLGAASDPWGVKHANFTATTTIDRRDWGLEWNAGLDTGGVLAGWKVQLDFDIQFADIPEEQPAATAD